MASKVMCRFWPACCRPPSPRPEVPATHGQLLSSCSYYSHRGSPVAPQAKCPCKFCVIAQRAVFSNLLSPSCAFTSCLATSIFFFLSFVMRTATYSHPSLLALAPPTLLLLVWMVLLYVFLVVFFAFRNAELLPPDWSSVRRMGRERVPFWWEQSHEQQ